METQPVPDAQSEAPQSLPRASVTTTITACIAGALIPGLGHAVMRKWDRAVVFFCSLTLMFVLGIKLQGRLVGPEFGDFFSTLKFIADAGIGILYWVPWLMGMGVGDPTAYTYDYANIFIYVAGLLNMLVIVDTFDIAMGRKP
jgi:hypothetical protein